MTTREDVVSLLQEMQTELLRGAAQWENDTLMGFLEAMEAWLNSAAIKNESVVSWELIKRMLIAGKIYE
jgi:hypothetical protein